MPYAASSSIRNLRYVVFHGGRHCIELPEKHSLSLKTTGNIATFFRPALIAPAGLHPQATPTQCMDITMLLRMKTFFKRYLKQAT